MVTLSFNAWIAIAVAVAGFGGCGYAAARLRLWMAVPLCLFAIVAYAFALACLYFAHEAWGRPSATYSADAYALAMLLILQFCALPAAGAWIVGTIAARVRARKKELRTH